MIKNERQYRITKAEAEKFGRAVAELAAAGTRPKVHPLLQKAELDGLRSQLEDLRAEIEEYEALKAGKRTVLEINSLEELPRAVVQARIAAGLSQKELADRLGLKEQQVQRYEATDYAGASMTRLQEVCRALGLNIRKDMFLSTPTRSPEKVFDRYKEMGLEKDFVMKRFVPLAVTERAKTNLDAEVGKVIFYATMVASHIYGWTPAAILGADKLWLDHGVLGAARFKVTAQAEERKLSAYTIYAHFLALQLLEATMDLPCKPIPTDADEARKEILASYGSITLGNVLRYVWDLGVPVLPLNDPGAFHGACWRVNGRNVIVLKQMTRALARWLHDLLHELFHAGEEPEEKERTVVEKPETSPERRESDEEVEATQFAADVVLAGRAEELVKLCVQATKRSKGPGRLELLKSELPKVAARENVPVDSLANYMAFRLSLQGENWWGAAMNLQRTDEDPWRIARDVLLERTNFSRLTGLDKDLLTQALIDTEGQ
jgi:transcriptional regulator with XRE-family HTH domain